MEDGVKKSKKQIIPLEDCLSRFVFETASGGKIVPASPAHFYSLKLMSKNLKFKNYEDIDYDPFKI